MRYFFFFILYCSLYASSARIVTYNLLNFSDDDDRDDDFSTIIEYIQPDIIIAQEVNAVTGFSHFKSDVLDIMEPNIWTGADFTNQTAQQDIALYYKHDQFNFLSTDVIYSAQSSGTRDVIEWVLLHEQSGVEFRVYGAHFKASSGTSNAAERLEEATILRDYLNELPSNSYFIVGGDFNIYSNSSSSEPAFEMLTGNSDDNDTLWCLDAKTGKILWKKTYSEKLAPKFYDGGPGATPIVDEGLVYNLSKSGRLSCYDAQSGDEKWVIEFKNDLSGNMPTWGFSSSPVVYGDVVLCSPCS